MSAGRYALRTVVEPSVEPLSLEEVKEYLNVDVDLVKQDAVIQGFIKASREWVERYTGRALIEQTLEARWDCFPCHGPILLPRYPVVSVEEIAYTDHAGAAQVWATANYQTDVYSEPARIYPAYNAYYPATRGGDFSALRVRFIAGYASGVSPATEQDVRAAVPEQLKLAMKVYLAYAFEGGPDSMLKAAENLAFPLRLELV